MTTTDLIPENPVQSAIEAIQHMSDLMESQKLDLLLMKLACKGATAIRLRKDQAAKNTEIKTQLEALGFFCDWHAENPHINQNYIELNITNNPDDLAFLMSNDFTNNARWGKLSGYPETAIAAFHSEDESQMIPWGEEPKEVRDAECFELLHFRLSKNNWREEMKVAEKWYHALQKSAPAFLEAYLAEKKAYRVWYEAELIRQQAASQLQA